MQLLHRGMIILLVAWGLGAGRSRAQQLPLNGPTRYVYSGYMDVAADWYGPPTLWTFTLTHLATNYWSYALRADQLREYSYVRGYGDQEYRYTLLSAFAGFYWYSGFPLSSNGCSMFGVTLAAGDTGFWSTAGCEGYPAPWPAVWYPGDPNGPVMDPGVGSWSTWEVEGIGTFSTGGSWTRWGLESMTALPEPSTLAFVGTGLAGLVGASLIRRRRSA